MQLKLEWVSNVIGDEFKKWKSGTGIFIDCQTGTGKSYFVERTLLSYCIENKKTMLYICNRINLKRQVKLDIAEAQGIDLSSYDMEAIDKLEQIGKCTIMTYHKIQNYKIREIYNADAQNELIDSYYDYIIMDEVQYINHDSSFVGKIQYFYNNYFPRVINQSIMIYLSANMDTVSGDIKKVYAKNNNSNIVDYSTGRDYSYVNAYYFNDYENLINTINNDDSGNKWMIYINSIDNAKEIQSKINDCKFICSQNNGREMDEEILQEIILTQKFSCKCVIATKALDNGVNVKDELLTNIVIITLNKIDFIQMLGRKRININDAQNVNLYIHSRGKKTFKTLLDKNLNKQMEKIELYRLDPVKFKIKYNNDHKKLPENLFYQSPEGGWSVNEIGYNNLVKQIEYCGYMIQRFKKGKLAYIFEQLNLLGLQYDSDNWLLNVPDAKIINKKAEDLIKYLGEFADNKIKLLEEQQEELISLLITPELKAMITNLNGGHKDRGLTMNKIKQLFQLLDIPFTIDSKNSSKTINKIKKSYRYWIISRL